MTPSTRRASALTVLLGLLMVAVAVPPAEAARRTGHGPLPPGVRAVEHPGLGRLTWLSGSERRPVASAGALGDPATPLAAATAFVRHTGMSAFGVADPVRSLRVSSVSTDELGHTFVRYRQTYRGLPVVAGELIVQVGAGHDVLSVGGRTAPSLSLDVRPTITATRARRLAVRATAAQQKIKASTLRPGPATLSVYDPALAGDPRRAPGARLAWSVDVAGPGIDEFTVIDARTGTALGAFNQVESAVPAKATQRICDLQGARQAEPVEPDQLQCDPGDPTLVASPLSSGLADAVAAFKGAQATYRFYAKRFGRDSLDDQGMPLISTVRVCPNSVFQDCPWPNAQWTGQQMLYGTGWASADDIVAHELTHGVTQFSSTLLYWFQSGAINEALSDIFGELIDQTNGIGNDSAAVRWLIGEDAAGGAVRNMADPLSSTQGAGADRMRSPYYFLDYGLLDNGAVHFNSGVGNKAAWLMTQGGTFNGQTVTGLGIDRSAAIWYRAATRYLTSGSDYIDLAAALAQSCRDLIGTRPLDGSGSPSVAGAITTTSCAQVAKALKATEMTLEPLVAAVRHAKLCPAGTAPTAGPLNDRIAATGAGWTAAGTPNVWSVSSRFTSSKPAAWFATDAVSGASASLRSKAFAIPATGTTYLAFRHYTNLQTWVTSYEGAVVEVATSPDGPWTDLGPAFVFNGYNGTVLDGYGNPLGGRSAFVGMNYGLATSKADLTFLKGQTVYLRFVIGTNADSTAFDGWIIDDVRVYRCQ